MSKISNKPMVTPKVQPVIKVQEPEDDNLVMVDQKSTNPSLKTTLIDGQKLRGLMRGAKGNKGKKLSNVRTTLIFTTTDTSGATTAQFPVYAVDPTACAEWSSWSGLYDEFRVHGIEVHARLAGSAGATPIDWAISYDPADVAALTAVIGALESSQHMGPFVLNEPGQVVPTAPTSYSKSGFHVKRFKIPVGAAVGNTGFVGNAWTDTGANNMVFGYVKAAVPALSAGTSVLTQWYKIDVELRSRR